MLAAVIASLALVADQSSPGEPASPCTPSTFRTIFQLHGGNRDDTVAVSQSTPDTRLISTMQFEGPCASLIKASEMDMFELLDGRVFGQTMADDFGLLPNKGPFADDDYDNRTAAERARPLTDGSPPITSVRVNSRKIGGDFVGLWKVREKWVVQSFSQLDDRRVTAPRPLLESSLPVRSVTYFPSPDTPAGRLEIVQEQPDGRTRAIAYFWHHPSAFTRP